MAHLGNEHQFSNGRQKQIVANLIKHTRRPVQSVLVPVRSWYQNTFTSSVDEKDSRNHSRRAGEAGRKNLRGPHRSCGWWSVRASYPDAVGWCRRKWPDRAEQPSHWPRGTGRATTTWQDTSAKELESKKIHIMFSTYDLTKKKLM